MSTAAAANPSSNALTASSNSGRQPKMSTSVKGIDAPRKPASPVDGGQRKPPPQTAWTKGTNPITQRSSTSATSATSNGVASLPKPQQASAGTAAESASPMRHLSDRMMFLLATMTGLPGIITLKNGEKYSGVLSGTSLDPTELRYVFKMVKRLLPAPNAQTNGAGEVSDDYVGAGESHVISWDISDVADFTVNNVVLDKSQAKGPNGTSGFLTDADISGNMAIRERNLQKWEPSEIDTDLTLESKGQSTDWDQFATNELITGVRSNYDESFYTTTINKSHPQYNERAANAEKIAREIEASSTLNSHVREERGGHAAINDAGADEEDRYSGVLRSFPALSTGQPNRYTPPARRPPASHATVPGAPVDPAIISASLARPDSKLTQRATSPAAEKPVSPSPSKPQVKVGASLPTTAQVETSKDFASKTEAKQADAPKPIPDQTQKPSSTIKSVPVTAPTRKPGRPHDATTNVEHDLLDSFKQFSAAEKLRISDRQRAFARENKAVKLNDLKKFALNFKLSTPVPSDLVPILAKDETKQQAIVEKALRQAQEIKSSPPKSTSITTTDPKAAARPATKPESNQASPSANVDRQQNQRPRPGQSAYASASVRERPHQNPNQIPGRNQGLLSTRLQLNQQQHKQQGTSSYSGNPQPIPAQDMRMPPTGPSQPSSGIQTPSSTLSIKFNVHANQFKPNPAAHTFQPSGDPSSSRPNSATKQEARRTPTITSFFGGQRPSIKPFDAKTSFNAIARMEKEVQLNEKSHNGDIAAPYWTPPTWDFPRSNTEKGYVQLFEHAPLPIPLAAPHNIMNVVPIPHQHQLPAHLQGPPSLSQGSTPQHTPRGPPVQPHLGQNQHHFDAQQMQFSHSTSSIGSSQRHMPPYMYSQQPQQMAGFPQQVQVPQYGMSPNVPHVSLRGGQNGQFISPPGPPIGGQMMTNQPSNGPYMGMPGNPQMQMYSPAPGPAYPAYPSHMPGPGAGGFPSPRPGAPMMSHQGSQQGHHQQPPLMYMQPGAQGPQMYPMQPGSMTPMRQPYPQLHQGHYGSPQQHHHFPQQHRGTPSGSYSQPMMQQHSMGSQVPPTGPANHGPDASDEPK